MKNFIIKKRSPLFIIFSIIFWVIACCTIVMIFVFNSISKMNHEKKWSDYDDCGIF